MAYFPMMVNLDNKKVLVIGGGEEGKKKVKIINEFKAMITLITPDASEEIIGMCETVKIKEFEDKDILDEDYEIIVAATDDRELNKRISKLANNNKIPVNIVDDEELCSFIFPAIIKDKDVVVGVSSSGKSPYVAQHIKALIKDALPENIGEINDRMGEYRAYAKKEISDTEKRREFLRKKLDEELRS